VWAEPHPDEHVGYDSESVELAFVAALQHLPASQRAVLTWPGTGFSAREAAESLETPVASVTARPAGSNRDERLPAQSQRKTVRALETSARRARARLSSRERGDVEAVAAMLADDAVVTMPPMATWFSGHDAVVVPGRAFARRGCKPGRLVRRTPAARPPSAPTSGTRRPVLPGPSAQVPRSTAAEGGRRARGPALFPRRAADDRVMSSPRGRGQFCMT
jgi:RNA polymerase sigma-70 factor (ECF subfamily)